jgi:type IV pilus assembly protein PilE
MMNHARLQRGFTLIELVVVIVIAAILSMIAANAYGNYLARAKVQAAKADLTALALNLENELQRNLVYGTHSDISTQAIEGFYKGWVPSQASSFTYRLTSSPTSYTLTADGISGPLANCQLKLDSTATGSLSGNCATVTRW